MDESKGWGWDKISFKPDEVKLLNELMQLTGGSIHETLRCYLCDKAVSQDELLRLIFIIENRERMLKTVDSIERGVYCETYGRFSTLPE